jgi:hypothetical protein
MVKKKIQEPYFHSGGIPSDYLGHELEQIKTNRFQRKATIQNEFRLKTLIVAADYRHANTVYKVGTIYLVVAGIFSWLHNSTIFKKNLI